MKRKIILVLFCGILGSCSSILKIDLKIKSNGISFSSQSKLSVDSVNLGEVVSIDNDAEGLTILHCEFELSKLTSQNNVIQVGTLLDGDVREAHLELPIPVNQLSDYDGLEIEAINLTVKKFDQIDFEKGREIVDSLNNLLPSTK